MHIGWILPSHARYRGGHTAVVLGEERLTYAQFNRRANQLANALLARGLKKGGKIATYLSNSIELMTIYWAAAKTGLVVAPLSPLLKENGLKALLRSSDAYLICADLALTEVTDKLRAGLPQIPAGNWVSAGGQAAGYTAYDALINGAPDSEPPDAALRGDDLYNIIYSSGTTGEPKGIMHTHFIRAMYAALFASAWRMTPESVVLHAGSIIFNGAFLTMLPGFYLGAAFIMLKAFDAQETIRTIEAEKVTHMMLVPAQIAALLNCPGFSPERLASLQMIGSVGAPLHLEHKLKLDAALPGRFYELYGVTEGFITILDKNDFKSKPQSVGKPMAFNEIRVMDERGNPLPPGETGEIAGRGPLMTPGYYGRPDLTAQAIRDGWLYSGDLGFVDEDGYLYLAGRKTDMIISGGVNVYPRDIEEVIVRHACVKECAVFGAPDKKWGESPIAAIILKERRSTEAGPLKEWINANVGAKFQRVREVLLLDEFPRSAAGKILKRELRAAFNQKQR